MLPFRSVRQLFPAEITWNDAKSSMPPTERASTLEDVAFGNALNPSGDVVFTPADLFDAYADYDIYADGFTANDIGSISWGNDRTTDRYLFKVYSGVISLSRLEPWFTPADYGYDPNPHPVDELPPGNYSDPVEDSGPPFSIDYYHWFPWLGASSCPPLVVDWPNCILNGDSRIPCFGSFETSFRFAVAHIPSWPIAFVPIVQKVSSDYSSLVWEEEINWILNCPDLLLGYQIDFAHTPRGSAPDYTIVSKVWAGSLDKPEDDPSTSFFQNAIFPVPCDEEPHLGHEHWEYPILRNYTSDLVAPCIRALDRVKPEVTFLDPLPSALYHIVNPLPADTNGDGEGDDSGEDDGGSSIDSGLDPGGSSIDSGLDPGDSSIDSGL